MNSIFLTICLLITNALFSSEDQNQIVTFSIKLKHQTQLGYNKNLDIIDQFHSHFLGIEWPREAQTLWAIETTHTKPGKSKAYLGPISMEYFTQTRQSNPFLDERLDATILFPTALPDSFVKKIIKNENQLDHKLENSTARFIIENPEQYQNQNINSSTHPVNQAKITFSRNTLYAFMSVGLVSAIALLLHNNNLFFNTI